MRNPFKELAGIGAGLLDGRRRRQQQLDELNAERGRANQPKPQAQPRMEAERRYRIYLEQAGRITPRQMRRMRRKHNRRLARV